VYSFLRDTFRQVWYYENKYSSDVCRVTSFARSQRKIFSFTLCWRHVRTKSWGHYLDLKRMMIMMEKSVIHNEFTIFTLRPKLLRWLILGRAMSCSTHGGY
jgi:hypothetical protein